MIICNIYIDDGWSQGILGLGVVEGYWYKSCWVHKADHSDYQVGHIEVIRFTEQWTISFLHVPVLLEREYVKWYSSTSKCFNSSLEGKEHFDRFLKKLSTLKTFL